MQTALPALQPETCCCLFCSLQPRGSRCQSPSQDVSSRGAAFQSALERAGLGKQLCLPPVSAARPIVASSSPIPLFHQHRSRLGTVVLPYRKASVVSAVSLCLNNVCLYVTGISTRPDLLVAMLTALSVGESMGIDAQVFVLSFPSVLSKLLYCVFCREQCFFTVAKSFGGLCRVLACVRTPNVESGGCQVLASNSAVMWDEALPLYRDSPFW